LAVAEVIHHLGVTGVGLKWPNDIVWQGHKLGGILLEMNGELSGCCHVVIGVGINVSMPRVEDRHIEQPWTDMARLLPGGSPSRNSLAARLIESMVAAIRRYENQGLNGMVQAWRAFDCCYGKAVALHLPSGVKYGTAWGVDPLGRLRLRHGGVEQLYSNGEISLRMRP
jgi:BirA family biotin operon repressor/biotin-[acetyl-CoA-carboxylase] ligase